MTKADSKILSGAILFFLTFATLPTVQAEGGGKNPLSQKEALEQVDRVQKQMAESGMPITDQTDEMVKKLKTARGKPLSKEELADFHRLVDKQTGSKPKGLTSEETKRFFNYVERSPSVEFSNGR